MLDNEKNSEESVPSPSPPPESEHDVWADDSLLGDASPASEGHPLGGSAPFPVPLGDNSDFEPATVFDSSGHDADPPPPRELLISPESSGYVPEIGDVLNERFEIRKLIAAGTLGLVYLVQDLRLKDEKALKLMHPRLMKNPLAEDRFIAEIKALQQLSHEHIVRIYDFGKTDRGDLSFFTMEYIQGSTLADLLKKKGGRLPVDKSLALVDQLLDTLTYAHQRCTHRNLKPVNIMVRPTGKMVLLNVGLSTEDDMGSGSRRATLGSIHFQAPELQKDPSLSSPLVDIYSVGVLLYLMLTGNVPLCDALPPSKVNRDLPRRLDKVIMRCLAEDPGARYTSAAEVRTALHRAMAPPILFYLVVSAILFLGVGLFLWGYLI